MASDQEHRERSDLSLRKIQVFNWLLLLVMAGAAWLFFSALVARSVFVGGAVANISFGLLQRDLLRLFDGPLQVAKVRFFIKYYLRLALLATVLFVLVRYRLVHIFGLLAGLSTVMLSIGINVAGLAKKI
jgi:hypothetical protein